MKGVVPLLKSLAYVLVEKIQNPGIADDNTSCVDDVYVEYAM
jgi:hypothetical protein